MTAHEVRHGVRLGVDVGSVRVGVAACDPDGVLATPVVTLSRDAGDLDALADLATERDALEVVVGLPTSLSGREGPAALAAREYATRVAARVAPVPVRLVDERLSTVTAEHGLRVAGVGGRSRRKVVDQMAAVVILQSALDAERRIGDPPGQIVPGEG
ncbi:MAG: Holliday junction resolvase RuvX [Streptosporangiales bacterium]|nr:Holliday junction resolvase RuvX [Streptosporangiales bacterium]MBO0891150.1 Holliday junction resolvase RuvX [Acidothermales bacterium]